MTMPWRKLHYKIIKTESVWNETFADLKGLRLKLWDYVH